MAGTAPPSPPSPSRSAGPAGRSGTIAPMPTIRANDLEIGYEQLGAGPPLVLLHGAGSSAQVDFAAQIPLLTTAFRLHLPDARGHGATRWDPADGFRAEWLVDDLAAFVDALELDTFHLAGFSMGAMIALGFAVRQPERVRTLVVASITPEREPRASVARRLLDPERIERDEPAWAAQVARRHDRVQGRDTWRRLLPAIAADVATQPLLAQAELYGITAPVLAICGDRDPMAPVDQVMRLARQVRDGRLLVVPDCRHEVLSERPSLVNEALGSFYRSTESIARERAERQPEVSR